MLNEAFKNVYALRTDPIYTQGWHRDNDAGKAFTEMNLGKPVRTCVSSYLRYVYGMQSGLLSNSAYTRHAT